MAGQVVDGEEHSARKRHVDNEHGEEHSEVEESRKKQKNNAGEDEEEEEEDEDEDDNDDGDDDDSIWARWQRFLSDPTNTQHLKALR